ncbi:MAG: hypothetical protein AAF141_07315 [Pseudomonadota bacterium]
MSNPKGVSYRTSAATTASIFGGLAACLWGAPELINLLFGIEAADASEVIMARAGVLFAAFASLLWASRNEPPSYLRTQIAFAVVLAMLGLVLFGMVELFAQRVGAGITFAMAVEVLIAGLFLPHAKGSSDLPPSEN